MTEKVFVNDNDMATFICPKCDKSKTVNVAKYSQNQKAVRVKCRCPCGNTYSVLLERRKFYRKQLNLAGTFFSLKGDFRGAMTVVDLSRSGMKIKPNQLRSVPDFKIGDKIVVEFHLDDQAHSLINREVVIKSIMGSHLGLAFSSTDHYDKLGPYLLFSIK